MFLNQGLVDTYIYDYIGLRSNQAFNPSFNLVIMDEMLTEDPLGIAIRKGNDQLLNDINDALKTLKSSGRLDEILSEYYNFKN